MLKSESLITDRLMQPAPSQIIAARLAAGLTPEDAAKLVLGAEANAEKLWRKFEEPVQSPSSARIPLAHWELFLLATNQHPLYEIFPVMQDRIQDI